MPIELDYNVLLNDLNDARNKELADYIREQVSYAINQARYTRNKERFTNIVTHNILTKVRQEEQMLDGKQLQQDNNDIPF